MTAFSKKQAVEALLFSSSEPIPIRRIGESLSHFWPTPTAEVRTLLDELRDEYDQQGRSFTLVQVEKGVLLRSRTELHPLLDQFHGKKRDRLSQATLEVLSIIAYQQPITRAQIDHMRGVDSSGPLQQLVARELVMPAGKLDAPGRPMLYKTTQKFLLHFGLESLKQIPK